MKITKEMKTLYENSLKIPPRRPENILLFKSWMNNYSYVEYYYKAKASFVKPRIEDDYEQYIADMDKKCLDYYERYMKAINSI
ncbi:hypothetical protein [Escherichia phage L27]|uniref:Uncharacterized protein n=1 Tax=Escherichia phage L27 TaxID=2562890 RepID=A0A455XIM8_9CAUD|nr:hypothetical protein [Escherichia phage L27]